MEIHFDYQELAKNCAPFLKTQPFLPLKEIAERYKVSRSFVYALIKEGKLTPYAFNTNSKHSRTFIKISEFEAALKPKAWADK